MAFQFSLATVLRVRGIAEEREERMLQQIVHETSQTMRAMDEAEIGILQSNAVRGQQVLQRAQALSVRASYGELEQRKATRAELQGHLGKLEDLRAAQMQVYTAARRNREMLTDMREEKRNVYDIGLARREQSTMDDNFMARRSRAS